MKFMKFNRRFPFGQAANLAEMWRVMQIMAFSLPSITSTRIIASDRSLSATQKKRKKIFSSSERVGSRTRSRFPSPTLFTYFIEVSAVHGSALTPK